MDQQRSPISVNSQSDGENKSIEEEMKLSHARISILWLLLDNQQGDTGLTITQIQQLAKSKSRKFIVLALQEMADHGLVERQKMDKTTYWSLTKEGEQIAEKFKKSTIWNG